jgi:hypothetical protein
MFLKLSKLKSTIKTLSQKQAQQESEKTEKFIEYQKNYERQDADYGIMKAWIKQNGSFFSGFTFLRRIHIKLWELMLKKFLRFIALLATFYC